MAKLTLYSEFIERLEELGFMSLSPNLAAGLPSLGEETASEAWHTGNPETDPWQWKDRAAEEKKAAYGCILGGEKGFVSAKMYPLFYAACHPIVSMPERWEAGQVNQITWALWQLFEKDSLLNTSDVRKKMGVSASSGGSRVDAGLRDLMSEYYLTIAGVRRRIGKDGQPFGWPASVFDKVANWAPAEWLNEVKYYEPDQAREMILDRSVEIGDRLDRAELKKKLGW
jgi:hypothetical protein